MGKNKIKIGDKAPNFQLESYNQGKIELAKEIEDQRVVLIFSRYFGCPICQLDWIHLLETKDQIVEKGAKILYITQSSQQQASKFINTEKVDFPVIHSSKDELYDEYGLGIMGAGAFMKVKGLLKEAKEKGIEHGEYEGWEKQSPGQFIVDYNGIIIHAEKGWLDVDALIKDL